MLSMSWRARRSRGRSLGLLPCAVRPRHKAARLTSKEFFPRLIGGPFHRGLVIVLSFAIGARLIAAVASWLRGGRYAASCRPGQRFQGPRSRSGGDTGPQLSVP